VQEVLVMAVFMEKGINYTSNVASHRGGGHPRLNVAVLRDINH